MAERQDVATRESSQVQGQAHEKTREDELVLAPPVDIFEDRQGILQRVNKQTLVATDIVTGLVGHGCWGLTYAGGYVWALFTKNVSTYPESGVPQIVRINPIGAPPTDRRWERPPSSENAGSAGAGVA